MFPLKTREEELLFGINDFIEEKKFPPTIREMSQILNFTSTNHTRCLLKNLIEEGFIKSSPKIARGIVIEERGKKYIIQYKRWPVFLGQSSK